MTSKFKSAVVLMAVVAMFALTASAAQAQFTASAYPANAKATSTADTFDAFGSTVKCTNNSFSGTLAAASSTITLSAVYKNCVVFGLPGTVNMTSCDFLFHRNAFSADTLDIACATAGDAIDITIYTSGNHTTVACHVNIPAQTGKTGFTLTNSGANWILSGSIPNLKTTQSRTNAVLCPPGTETTTANYTIQAGGITVSREGGGSVSVD